MLDGWAEMTGIPRYPWSGMTTDRLRSLVVSPIRCPENTSSSVDLRVLSFRPMSAWSVDISVYRRIARPFTNSVRYPSPSDPDSDRRAKIADTA